MTYKDYIGLNENERMMFGLNAMAQAMVGMKLERSSLGDPEYVETASENDVLTEPGLAKLLDLVQRHNDFLSSKSKLVPKEPKRRA